MHTIGKTAVACGCAIMPTTIHPVLMTGVIIVSLIVIALAVRMLVLLVHTIISTRRTLKSWRIVSSRLMKFDGRIFAFTVVALDAPLLCSAGVLDQTIYISTHTLNTLSNTELLAATLHELGHLKHHHPLHFQLFTALTRAFFMSQSSLTSYHAFAHENTADVYALRFVPRSALLSAITHFFAAPVDVALPHFSLEESRIKMLLGYAAPQAPRALNLALLALCITACMSFFPLTLFAQTDPLPELKNAEGRTCAYVEPPSEQFVCLEGVNETIFLYQSTQ